MSPRLIPELKLLDNQDEFIQAERLSRIKYRRRTALAFGPVIFWAGIWCGGADYVVRFMGLVSQRWLETVISAIALVTGLWWMHNYAVHKPMKQAVREVLQRRGVPICIKCGYDLRGQSEARCPECGLAFDEALLERAASIRKYSNPDDDDNPPH